MQLSDVPAAVQLQVRHHRHVSPAIVCYPKSIWFSDRWTRVMVLNLDGLWEACGNRVALGTYVCSTCHIVHSVSSSFLRPVSLSCWSQFPLLSLSVVISLSFSLPQNRTLLRAMVVLSLFLSPCFHSPFFLFARLLSFSLANRTSNSLILSPTLPPTLSLSLSPTVTHATVMDLSALRRCVWCPIQFWLTVN